MDREGFRRDVESLVNRYSLENGSNTPDFILAQYIHDCLLAYDRAVNARALWYGPAPEKGGITGG